MSKREKLVELLKRYGVDKCYVSEGFDFEAIEGYGKIYVGVNNSELITEIYKLYTLGNDGYPSDDQVFLVRYDKFNRVKPNLEVI